MALSPFDRTIWLDVDCEVRGSLQPLFFFPLSSAKFSATSADNDLVVMTENTFEMPHYSAGVVIYEKGSAVIQLWNREIHKGSQIMCSEEDLLSLLIAHFEIEIVSLPHLANWEVSEYGPNPSALIYHWTGEKGKKAIHERLFADQNGNGACSA